MIKVHGSGRLYKNPKTRTLTFLPLRILYCLPSGLSSMVVLTLDVIYLCVVPDKNDVVDWHVVVMKFIGML